MFKNSGTQTDTSKSSPVERLIQSEVSFNSGEAPKQKQDGEAEQLTTPELSCNFEPDLKQFIKERYTGKTSFENAYAAYKNLPVFAANGNIYEVIQDNNVPYNKDIQQIVRLATQFGLQLTFRLMKMDIDNDPNLLEDLVEGNKGTPARLAKMWVGSDLEDDEELLSGRWTKPPRIATFPNNKTSSSIPITKRVDIVSCCSHHIAPFSTFFREDSYAIVSYIPEEKVLGISKLQRVVNWVARRAWLQEDLTKTIYEELVKVTQTQSVYVKLVNVSHTCESLRGSQTRDGAFTSEYYGGLFSNPELRKEVRAE